MYSQEVIKLTPQTVEALKKLSIKCPKCKGKGRLDVQGVSFPKPGLQCDKCNGTGKVGGWTWKPKVGEWYIDEKNKVCLVHLEPQGHIRTYGEILEHKNYRDCIPILHWETLEEILEGLRYDLWIEKHSDEKFTCEIFKEIDSSSATKVGTRKIRLCCKEGKTRQLAVMLAVIALWKEMKKCL